MNYLHITIGLTFDAPFWYFGIERPSQESKMFLIGLWWFTFDITWEKKV